MKREAELIALLQGAIRAKLALWSSLIPLVEHFSRGDPDDPAIDDIDWHLAYVAVDHSSEAEIQKITIAEVRKLIDDAARYPFDVCAAESISTRRAKSGVARSAQRAVAIVRGEPTFEEMDPITKRVQ